MTLWKSYHMAYDLVDALNALDSSPGPARLIAGGTDLLLDLQQGRCPPVQTLVDITQVPELCKLETRQESLFIGAAVPLSVLSASELVQYHATALYQACQSVGGLQVRNTATLGGNVAHALPAGDGSIALLSLDAKAEIISSQGRRVLPLAELYLGPGKSMMDTGHEILVGFYLPVKQAGEGSAFRRIMRPQGVALPVLNMAIWMHAHNASIAGLRVAVGPAGTVPYRAREVEEALLGQHFDPDCIETAIKLLLKYASFRTSPQRSTATYRRHLAGILLKETIQAAWENATYGIHP